MNKYEAMFIVKPDLSEANRKALFTQLNDAVAKNGGSILTSGLWSEKRKMWFPIRKFHEGVYYLMNFNLGPEAVAKIRNIYRLNEDVLRVLITRAD